MQQRPIPDHNVQPKEKHIMATSKGISGGASAAERKGAAAMQRLLRELHETANRQIEAAWADGQDFDDDERDYVGYAARVRASLEANLHHADPLHARGYLRALTDLLSMTADGCGPGDEWDPLRNTARAFAAHDSGR